MVVLLVSSASGQVLTNSERKPLEDEVAANAIYRQQTNQYGLDWASICC
jgi:hypothetical protein